MKIRRDGKAYDGGDATITALGQVWEEVTAIEYGTTQEHQKNHTIGSRRATSWSMGKIDHTGSITMMMETKRWHWKVPAEGTLVEHQAVSYQCDIRGRLITKW